MQIIFLITILLSSLLLALFLIPVLIRLAGYYGWVEQNDERKIHTERISNLGGVGILLAAGLVLPFVSGYGLKGDWPALLLALPLFVIGLIDDRMKTGITIRLIIQIFCGMMLFDLGYRIIDVEGHWWLSLGATVLFLMIMINAYNFIDGINGLAGGFGLLGSLVFGFLFFRTGNLGATAWCLAYAGALLGFLRFNFGRQARIFMGDSGSTVMGFGLSVMILTLLRPEVAPIQTGTVPVIFSVIIIPVIDLFKVAMFRIFRLQSPFNADRTHIHHLLTDRLLSHPLASIFLWSWSILLLALFSFWPSLWNMPVAFTAAVLPYFMIIAYRMIKGTISAVPAPVPTTGSMLRH